MSKNTLAHIDTRPIADGREILVQSHGENLLELPRDTVIHLIRNAGVVLFRGFVTDPSIFTKFIRQNSHHVAIDPARKYVHKNAQLVDAGTGPIGLHCENGATPVVPHFAWFFCERAAARGSETTYCDGERVWSGLVESSRDLFRRNRITYSRSVGESVWRAYVCQELPLVKAPEDATEDHLRMMMNAVDGLTLNLNDDETLTYQLSVAAVHTSLFSDALAFANSILGPSYNYEAPTITFEGGTAIPIEVLLEIEEVSAALTYNIDWCHGDIAVLDNTRYMHGRRQILDSTRRLLNGLSSIDPTSLVP